MGRVVRILLGSVFVCILFAAIAFGLAFFLTQGVADGAETFMKAVQEDRFEDAYALFTIALQDEVSLDDFTETFDPFEIESWSFGSRNVENNLGQVSGTASIDGSNYVVVISFVNDGDKWLIDGYQFTEASEED